MALARGVYLFTGRGGLFFHAARRRVRRAVIKAGGNSRDEVDFKENRTIDERARI